MNTELSVPQLIMEASLVVQFVLLLLAAASIASWAVIFETRRTLKNAMGVATEFQAIWVGSK